MNCAECRNSDSRADRRRARRRACARRRSARRRLPGLRRKAQGVPRHARRHCGRRPERDGAGAACAAASRRRLPPESSAVTGAGHGLGSAVAPRRFFGGFAVGTALSGALAASLVLTVFRTDPDQTIADEVVSAHIRSLQPGHLMDVETSDQHTVKPWFNGKVDVAPPVIDLTAQGFTLLGGRLDYIDGEPVASVVYRRRKHVINLFVAQRLGSKHALASVRPCRATMCATGRPRGLDFWAVSDLDGEELSEFVGKISAALHPSGGS